MSEESKADMLQALSDLRTADAEIRQLVSELPRSKRIVVMPAMWLYGVALNVIIKLGERRVLRGA